MRKSDCKNGADLIDLRQPRKGNVTHVLDPVEIQVYRRETLAGGFDDALFLAEMVNIAEPNARVFAFTASGDDLDAAVEGFGLEI